MTTQVNVGKIWAITGQIENPGDTKYALGWEAEIPTFQNFNFVLQNYDKNFLVLAEQAAFAWQSNITYAKNAMVYHQGMKYYGTFDGNIGNSPLYNANAGWRLGEVWGEAGTFSNLMGAVMNDVSYRSPSSNWVGQDVSLIGHTGAKILLGNKTDINKSLLIGNHDGKAFVMPVNVNEPDDRSLSTNMKELFHEGHPPIQSEVVGTIPANPEDGTLYGRKDGNWVKVTTVTVAEHPPQPTAGDGAGWYNLADGTFYLDIDDGDSSQWVPASPLDKQFTHETIIALGNSIGVSPNNTALSNLIGDAQHNTALGENAGLNMISTSFSNAIGFEAGFNSVADVGNNFVGALAGHSTNGGSRNNFMGMSAGYYVTVGSRNVAIGDAALWGNSGGMTGSYNNAIGNHTLSGLTTGSYNSAMGFRAGQYRDAGLANKLETFDDTICIGSWSYATASGEMSLGNSAYITAAYTAAPFATRSDERYKDFQTNDLGLDFINALDVKKYTWNTGADQVSINYGFSAQQVKAVLETQVGDEARTMHRDRGGEQNLTYTEFVAPLVKAVQTLSDKNDELESKVTNLQAQIDVITASLGGV